MLFQIKDVRDHRKENRMESFFLAETTKYLYLLFDTDNFIHNQGQHGTVINTPNGECIVEAGGYIFNTEAHPIDPSALQCCHEASKRQLFDFNEFNAQKRMFRGETIEKHHNSFVPIESSESNETEAKATIVPLHEDDGSITVASDQMKFDDENISTVNSTGSAALKDKVDGGGFLSVPEIIKQGFFENSSTSQDPQQMLERIRTEKKYQVNSTWESNYRLLSCKAQPFLQRLSVLGEVF